MSFTPKTTVSLFAVEVFNSPAVDYATDWTILEYIGPYSFEGIGCLFHHLVLSVFISHTK